MDDEPAARTLRRRRSAPLPTTRVEAFSDGVFAIAITLLVLELHVPTGPEVTEAGGLLPALGAEWASWLAYLAAFATIGAVWLNHHAAFTQIGRVDRTVLGLNLLVLLGASFIPFPTALVAEHLGDGPFSEEARTATAVYAVVGIACCVPWLILYRHLARHPHLLATPFTAADLPAEVRRGRFGAVLYAFAVVVALVAPVAAVVLFLVGSIYYAATAVPPMREDDPDPAPSGAGRTSED